jgi:hypothetical protein
LSSIEISHSLAHMRMCARRRSPKRGPRTRSTRTDGVGHRILVVERNGKERFVARNSLHIAVRAPRVVPDVPLESERISIVTRRELRIDRDGLAKEGLRDLVVLRAVFVEVP